MKKIVLCLLLCICLFTSCSKVRQDEQVDNQEQQWMNETDRETDRETVREESETQTVSENTTSRDAGEDEEEVDGIFMNINLINQKNMPIASDTLTYKGERMEYAVVLTNGNDFQVDYTFMILVNGCLQPFTLESGGEELYSTKYALEAKEEKIVGFSFTPICAPYGRNALISFVGIIEKNKNPFKSRVYSMLNASEAEYSKFLTAENESCEIKSEDGEYSPAKKLAEMEKEDYENTASSVSLSDTEQNEDSIDQVMVDEVNVGKAISLYFAKRYKGDERCVLLRNGEIVNAFAGKPYIDFPGSELMLYQMPIDKGIFEQGKKQNGLVIIINKDIVDEILEGGADEIARAYIGFSQLYFMS